MLNYRLTHENLFNCLVNLYTCQDLKQFINTAAVADFCSLMLNSHSWNVGGPQESKIHKSLRAIQLQRSDAIRFPFVLLTTVGSQGHKFFLTGESSYV